MNSLFDSSLVCFSRLISLWSQREIKGFSIFNSALRHLRPFPSRTGISHFLVHCKCDRYNCSQTHSLHSNNKWRTQWHNRWSFSIKLDVELSFATAAVIVAATAVQIHSLILIFTYSLFTESFTEWNMFVIATNQRRRRTPFVPDEVHRQYEASGRRTKRKKCTQKE